MPLSECPPKLYGICRCRDISPLTTVRNAVSLSCCKSTEGDAHIVPPPASSSTCSTDHRDPFPVLHDTRVKSLSTEFRYDTRLLVVTSQHFAKDCSASVRQARITAFVQRTNPASSILWSCHLPAFSDSLHARRMQTAEHLACADATPLVLASRLARSCVFGRVASEAPQQLCRIDRPLTVAEWIRWSLC